jgi:hypothetical protein
MRKREETANAGFGQGNIGGDASGSGKTQQSGKAPPWYGRFVIVGKVQADSSGSGGDDCVELFPLLECCQKRECLAVGRNRSGQIVECRGVFRHNTSGYLGIR